MATAWPSTARTKYAPNKAVRASWLADLCKRQDVLAHEYAFPLADDAVLTTASGSEVTLFSWTIALPAHAYGLYLCAGWYAQVSGGATAVLRLRIGATSGATVTLASSYAWTATTKVAVPTSGATITIDLRAQVTVGSGTISVDQRAFDLNAWFED